MIEPIWIWAAFGIALLTIEMTLVGTLDIVWFGIAALCVAIAIWLFPTMPYAMQFTMFSVLALSSLAIWRLYYKKTETHSRIGQSQGEEIGRTGRVTQACGPTQTGHIQFTQGLMGAKDWPSVSDETIESGAEANVVAVEGNTLRIKAV